LSHPAPTAGGDFRWFLGLYRRGERRKGLLTMAWTTPTLVEICIGLEINGYLPPEF
jgi:coenzyme PQQ precursor peptide PqqA